MACKEWDELSEDERRAVQVGYEIGWTSGYCAGVQMANGGASVITNPDVITKFTDAIRMRKARKKQQF